MNSLNYSYDNKSYLNYSLNITNSTNEEEDYESKLEIKIFVYFLMVVIIGALFCVFMGLLFILYDILKDKFKVVPSTKSVELIIDYNYILEKASIAETNIDEAIESNECSICKFSINNSEFKKTSLKCGHKFHLVCINFWLQNNNTCPICRQIQ